MSANEINKWYGVAVTNSGAPGPRLIQAPFTSKQAARDWVNREYPTGGGFHIRILPLCEEGS